VKRLNVSDKQVRDWFDHYQVAVGVEVFRKPVPPEGLASDILKRFRESLLAYENSQKRAWFGKD